MKLKKHLYLQKPLTHDIYEARVLTQAAKKYKVVTQMGDQGASCDGIRTMREWFEAGLIGDIEKVYCWTNRPVWPQGIPGRRSRRRSLRNSIGTCGSERQSKPITSKILFRSIGVAGGDLEPAHWEIWVVTSSGPSFKLLELGYPTEITGSASTVY